MSYLWQGATGSATLSDLPDSEGDTSMKQEWWALALVWILNLVIAKHGCCFFFFLTEKQIMMQDLEAHLPILEEMITLSQNLIVSFMKNEQSSYIRQARPHI